MDMTVATFLSSRYGIDYFDSIFAGQCLLRKAKPLTTDEEIFWDSKHAEGDPKADEGTRYTIIRFKAAPSSHI